MNIVHAWRVLICFLAVAQLSQSQEVPSHHLIGTYGTRSIHIGSSGWIHLHQAWFSFVPATINPATNVITAPGHAFVNGTQVRFRSSSALPWPLNQTKSYTVCNVSGSDFTIVPTGSYACAGTKRVTFTGIETGILEVGVSQRYQHVYIRKNVRNLPPGVTVEFWCQANLCPTGKAPFADAIYSYQGYDQFFIKLTVSPSTPPGPVTLEFDMRGQNEPTWRTVAVPMRFEQLQPVAMAKPWTSAWAPPAPLPIPQQARWESTMTNLAYKWCPVPGASKKMSFGVESQEWFYDGAAVYYKVADYTGNAAWKGCALNIASQYADWVATAKGFVPGYSAFVDGLERAYKETQDPRFTSALNMMLTNGPMHRSGGQIKETYIREVAYYLRVILANDRINGTQSPLATKYADILIGMFDSLTVSDSFEYHQIFMDGLGMRSLIDYWETTKDPRVPRVVKTALDWIWTNAWIPSQQTLVMNPEVLGPRCDWGCREGDTSLINLTAPAFAWYWSVSGDPLYRNRGDELFAASLKNDISWNGKIFSQNYTWSFDYVKWRKIIPGVNPQ